MIKNCTTKWFNRIVALTISISIASISLPINSHASSVSGDPNSEGNQSGSGNVYGAGGFVTTHQGYRFYIVDVKSGQPQRVSGIFDFTFEKNVSANKQFTNGRWEPLSTSQSDYQRGTITDLVNEWCAGSINASGIQSIYPTIYSNGNFNPQGLNFRKWFIGDGGGSSSSSIATNHNPSSGLGGGSSSETTAEDRLAEAKAIAQSKAEVGARIFDGGMSSAISYYNAKSAKIDNLKLGIQQVLSANKNTVSFALNQAINTYGMTTNEARNYAAKIVFDSIAGYNYSTTEYKLDSKTKEWIAQVLVASAKISTDGTVTGWKNISNNFNGLVVSAKYTNEDTEDTTTDTFLTQSIPLAGDSDKPRYPAEAFLTYSSLVVQGFNTDVDDNGVINAIDALKYNENGEYRYYLIVEPLVWLGVTNSSGNLLGWIYGSYYNILEYWALYANNPNAKGINHTFLTKAGKNSLTLNRDYTEFGGYANSVSGYLDRMSVTQNYSLAKDSHIGFAMHIYCGVDMGGSLTSTYDESLGESIGPAPDDSALLTLIEQSTPTQYANIVKFYPLTQSNPNRR